MFFIAGMKKNIFIVMLLAFFVSPIVHTASLMAFEVLPKMPPIPKDNPTTTLKITLGKQLYFDPRLSLTGAISCNSCHNVMAGGDDNLPVSFGVGAKTGTRSSPTVWNAAFNTVQFWDGRAQSLEEQAKGPIHNPVEMGMPSLQTAADRLKKIPGYVSQFQKAFGGSDPVNGDNIAKAIATYERTLLTPNAPADRFLSGDKKAMSLEAQRGMKLVESTGCTTCHMGPNYNAPAGLAMGQGFFQKFPVNAGTEYETKYKLTADLGRAEETKKNADSHLWRVATWRNIALTAPYFHNGSVKTLPEAVRVMAKTQLNKTLADGDVNSIVAFLNALTGELPKQQIPLLPTTPGTTVLE